MKKIFMGCGILLSLILFTACGSDSTTTTSSSTSGDNDIKVYTKQSLLDPSQKRFYLEFDMKNNYSSGIVAQLSNISLDLNACSVSSSNLNILDNSIEFSEPLESRTVQFTANFVNACTPNGYRVNANSYLTYDGTSKKGSYSSSYYPISIDGNLTIEDTTSIFEYDIKLESVDDEPKIGLESKKRYKLSLFNSSSNKNVVADRVHNMTIKSSDPSKVKLIDPNNYNSDQATPQSELTFSGDNEIVFYIQTYNTSGIADFDVTVSYSNNRGEIYDIERKTSIVILSGEPTAFSINDTGVTYNSETKWFKQTFLVSASDKYNNIVNIPSKINISAIADFRDKNGKGDRVLYGKFGLVGGELISGELIADKENHTASFKANKEVFGNINPDRDYLILFGDATTSEALGKWDIDPYTPLKNQLKLPSSYYGDSHASLGFAVGHNYMNEICSSESKEWELQIDSTDGTYQLDEEGKASVTLKFPGYMIGKKIALSVDFSGKNRRAGEVHFQTLYSFDGVVPPETIDIDANTTVPTTMTHFFIVDTGTEDEFIVRNAKVHCNTKSENVKVTKIENSEIKTVFDCKGSDNGESAFWQLTLELVDKSKGGSLSFEECQVSSFIDEF